MRLPRSTLAAFGVWLLVVAVGSALVWAVISRAGEGVVSSESLSVPSASGGPAGTAPVPSLSPTGSPTDGPTAGPTDTPSDRLSDSPSDEPSGVSSGPPVSRTWQGLGGTVVASCSGTAVGLVGAHPDDGFAVEVRERGPRRLDVEFEEHGEGSERKTRVRATCSGSVATFDVESDRD